jgi:hypothetical protein
MSTWEVTWTKIDAQQNLRLEVLWRTLRKGCKDAYNSRTIALLSNVFSAQRFLCSARREKEVRWELNNSIFLWSLTHWVSWECMLYSFYILKKCLRYQTFALLSYIRTLCLSLDSSRRRIITPKTVTKTNWLGSVDENQSLASDQPATTQLEYLLGGAVPGTRIRLLPWDCGTFGQFNKVNTSGPILLLVTWAKARSIHNKQISITVQSHRKKL